MNVREIREGDIAVVSCSDYYTYLLLVKVCAGPNREIMAQASDGSYLISGEIVRLADKAERLLYYTQGTWCLGNEN